MLFIIIHYPGTCRGDLACRHGKRIDPRLRQLTIVVVGLLALAARRWASAASPSRRCCRLMQAHDGLSPGPGRLARQRQLPRLRRRRARLQPAAAAAACGGTRRPGRGRRCRPLAMGVTADYPAWLVLRFVAGVASACVLVGVSAWALPALGARGTRGLVGRGLRRGRRRHCPGRRGRAGRRHRRQRAGDASGCCSARSAARWSRRSPGGRSPPMPPAALAGTAGLEPIRHRRLAADRRLRRLRLRLHHSGDLPAGDGARGDRRPGRLRLDLAGLRRHGRGLDRAGRAAPAPRAAGAALGREPRRHGASACSRRRSRPGWRPARLRGRSSAAPSWSRRWPACRRRGACAGAGAPRLMAAMTAAFALGQLAVRWSSPLATAAGADGIAGPSLARRRRACSRAAFACAAHGRPVTPRLRRARTSDMSTTPPTACRRSRASG